MDGAGAALTKTAAETGAMQPKVIAQHVKQRHLWVVVRDRHTFAIHIK
jgi:hypothetical protein